MKIDLNIPTSWSKCSLAQLRALADIIVERSEMATPLVPFSIYDVKVAAFFRLANLEIVENVDVSMDVERQFYRVRKRPFTLEEEGKPFFFLREWTYRARIGIGRWMPGKYAQPFKLYVWQMQSWIEPVSVNRKKAAGVLDWMSDGQRSDLLIFPMKTLKMKRAWWGRGVEFRGPSALMDGFTWQRYRYAQDYMQLFMKSQNRLVRLRQMGVMAKRQDLRNAEQAVRTAKAMFLATIFIKKEKIVDEKTRLLRKDFRYVPSETAGNARFFTCFTDRDWQIVLLWWSSMMLYLSRTFRRVFKRQDVDGEEHRRMNPMEIYTRTTATMEKYLSMTAADVDNEPYTVILQQLEDIANQNAEMERINKQMKAKK